MSKEGRVGPQWRSAAARFPQSTFAVRTAHRLTGRHLRILGFHGVPDLDHFAGLVETVCDRYQPVSADDVAESLATGTPLPRHAVWFTFDDGLASTLEAGDLLAGFGISATAFVCPSVIDRGGWLWFQTVQAAMDHGLTTPNQLPHDGLTGLKKWPNPARNALVKALEVRLHDAGVTPPATVTQAELHTWAEQGHSIGNHTWDHPCLDTCPPEVQRAQVRRAHTALQSWGLTPMFFAYPNGNWTQESQDELVALGYTGSLLFDHRLTGDVSAPQQLSRLRIDADAETQRALAILSGTHSGAYQATQRLRTGRFS